MARISDRPGFEYVSLYLAGGDYICTLEIGMCIDQPGVIVWRDMYFVRVEESIYKNTLAINVGAASGVAPDEVSRINY